MYCDRAPVLWSPRGPVGPESLLSLICIGNLVTKSKGPVHESYDDVRLQVRLMLEVRGGETALWELLGQGFPIWGLGGGVDRRTPGGIYCSLRRSGRNLLAARLHCVQ